MIVDEPPYELVALFADEDARRFVMRIIERGQQRKCLRPFRWRAIRDARRDTVARVAETVLRPFSRDAACRYLVMWDRDGSGREAESALVAQDKVVSAMAGAGIDRERVTAVCLEPELETVLAPVWTSALRMLAARRGRSPPPDAEILAHLGPGAMQEWLLAHPKETLDAALRVLNLRHSPALFEDIGEQVSIPDLKAAVAVERFTSALLRWFPPG
jgi:hypothetical protein